MPDEKPMLSEPTVSSDYLMQAMIKACAEGRDIELVPGEGKEGSCIDHSAYQDVYPEDIPLVHSAGVGLFARLRYRFFMWQLRLLDAAVRIARRILYGAAGRPPMGTTRRYL